MKKTAAALALMVLAATATPSFAATSTGAVKFGWTIPANFTAHIASNYKTAQSSLTTGTATFQPSVAGACTATGNTDTAAGYALAFGSITLAGAAIGCNYQNAIGISVNTNDTLGYNIYESLDVAAAPANYGVCFFTDGASTTATTPASIQASAPAAGTFSGANVLTACAGSGVLAVPASGTITNAGVGGDVASGTNATASTNPTTAVFTVAAGTPATGTNYFGEDVQLNIPATAPSVTGASHAIILYFVPN